MTEVKDDEMLTDLSRDKYVLRVLCEHREDMGDKVHQLWIPLCLNGDETTEEAIERFRDALAVAKCRMREHHGRPSIASRISGVPTIEEAIMVADALRQIGA